ncbi:MAG: tetratricopeptide repeat protein [Planctomycetota bacterium]
MKLNKEQIALLVVVLLVGWLYWSSGDDRYESRTIRARTGRVDPPELWVPEVRFSKVGDWGDESRDIFEAPSDVSPMPPLVLAAPPLDPPPVVFPIPRPSPAADHLEPLRHVPVIRSSESEDETSEEPSDIDTADVAPAATDERGQVEPARVYDAIVLTDGSTNFGWILNENKFELDQPSRREEPIRFDVQQGGLKAVNTFERNEIREYRFAPTVPNLYEIKRREFEPTPGNAGRVAQLAEWCLEKAQENPAAFDFALEQYRVLLGLERADKSAAYRGLAEVHRSRFDPEAELKIYREATAAGVQDPKLMVDFGDLYERLGMEEAAEKIYRELVERDGFDRHGRLALGRLLVKTGRPELAKTHLDAAASASLEGDEIRELNYWQGRRQLALGELDGAKRAFEQVVQLAEAWPDGYAGLAATLFLQGDESGALRQIERGLEGAGEDGALRYDRALAEMRQGNLEDAGRDLARAARLDPFLAAPVEIARGYLAETAGDVLDARDRYETAVEMAPMLPMAHYHLGRAQRASGDEASAFEAFTRALALEWRSHEVVHELAYLTYGLGQYDEAARFVSKALEREPSSQYLLVLAGLIALKQGRLDAAMELFDSVPEDRQSPTLQCARAICYYQQGNSREARGLLGRVRDTLSAQGDSADLLRMEYAARTLGAIQDNESKELWSDDFNRRQLTKGWETRESFGITVSIDDGQVLFQGEQANESDGLTILAREETGRSLVAFEATLNVSATGSRVRTGLMIQIRRAGRNVDEDRWAELAFARGPRGDLQTYLRRNHKVDQDWTSIEGSRWPSSGPVTLRIERLDPEEPVFTLSVNGEVAGEIEFSSMKSYSLGVHLGIFGQAGLGESYRIAVDDVRIIRRKG